MRFSQVFTFFALFLGTVNAFDPLFYPNVTVLREGIYNLFWKLDGDEIYLALEVETSGWVGFGLGEPTSGSMPGADIITGYVTDDGAVYIQDRHAVAKELPLIDDCQNWELLSGEETDGKTIIEVKRLLDTGDNQDRPFTSGPTRIVFAFGDVDIVSYHESNRQATSMVFFGEPAAGVPSSAENVTTLELTLDNFEIPPVETYYHEEVFVLPEFDSDVHIIAIEEIIMEATKNHVHHFLLFGCTDLIGDNCTLNYGWAPGIGPLVLPEVAGFRAGPSDGAFKSMRMQTHYDNPEEIEGMVDSSGIRVYYTANLRPNDASVLQLGDPAVTDPNNITAGQGTKAYEYNCPGECTSTWPHSINVFGDLLHMHAVGSQIWTTQWRNGEMLRETNRIEFWDFNFQQTTTQEFTIEPGDRLNTHCIYFESDQEVPFGRGSRDEMCINYLFYYPILPGVPGFCSYLFQEELGRNVTVCMDSALIGEQGLMFNPTVTDPPGGEEIHFGKPNPTAYECADVVTTLEPVPSDSSASVLTPWLVASFFAFVMSVFTTESG